MADPTSEFELKMQVPPERLAELEEALQRDTVERTRLRARYFDTPDGALAAAGLVLRIRQEGESWVQTAKGPGRGGFERLEHNVPLGPGGAELPPEIVRHRGHPVHELLVQALHASAADLQPTFETDVLRAARTLRAGGVAVEIALDRGEVRAGPRAQRVQELELELKEGTPAAAIELARSWCRNHGLWLDPQSKSAVGRRLAAGEDAPPSTARTIEARPRELLPAIFEGALQQILANARELAAGSGGEGHVHQLRVGLRRLRSALRELPLKNDPLDDHVAPALANLFHHLGEHRDRATLLPALLRELEAAGHPLHGWQPPTPDPGALVRDADVQDALVTLVGWTRSLHDVEGVSPKKLRRHVAHHLQALHDQMVRAGKRFERLAPEDRHKVRKRLKRLRYLAELVQPLYHRHAVQAYVDALKHLQDALGRYQDAAAGRALFEERAAEDPQAWFGAGWLAGREPQLAHACARACRKTARKAKPFWA